MIAVLGSELRFLLRDCLKCALLSQYRNSIECTILSFLKLGNRNIRLIAQERADSRLVNQVHSYPLSVSKLYRVHHSNLARFEIKAISLLGIEIRLKEQRFENSRLKELLEVSLGKCVDLEVKGFIS